MAINEDFRLDKIIDRFIAKSSNNEKISHSVAVKAMINKELEMKKYVGWNKETMVVADFWLYSEQLKGILLLNASG